MESVSDILDEKGPLARVVPGFAPRPGQQAMAEAVAGALESESVLVAEAGTGTGKTFAYLVPALLSGKKVIISTGTKNLQDQLFHRDLPVVREALGVPVDVALLKGRANYLCQHRLETSAREGLFRSREQAALFRKVSRWAEQTPSGDLAELPEFPEDAPIIPMITSTADNCLGSDCEHLEECFLAHARRRAQEADILVVNHHLLFADMALKDDGFGELLPGANAFILDEAHQLPETASNFFGVSVGGNQLRELARDTIAEDLKEAGEDKDVPRAADRLEKAALDLRLALGDSGRREPWANIAGEAALNKAVAAVEDTLTDLHDRLEPLAGRGKGLENCHRRCGELLERFAMVSGETPEGYIHWFETHTRSFTLSLTPMDVAEIFRGQVESLPRAWVLTSATLAVGDSFEHFTRQLGLRDTETGRWESPFNFREQALFYVPDGLPEPRSPDYTAAVVEEAIPVLQASRGRAFMLFTSHRALREAAERLEGVLDYPLLVQGEAPRARLLERFRELGNAVLLGTGSFWEGVDVRGEALSCVIIDKLPFAAPNDPVMQARIEAMQRDGRNPFRDYQLPQAVITLKQGVGRLIRDVNDRGLLMVCDPRLLSRSYGRIFLESLPRMLQTRSGDVVQRFFAHIEREAQ